MLPHRAKKRISSEAERGKYSLKDLMTWSTPGERTFDMANAGSAYEARRIRTISAREFAAGFSHQW
ncbi:hypothetical protein LB553_27170 [Mesorhizobium sp. CA8]|uniref:hypothetical protein n=1 Tax=Mesorhizobium sp. CA8 TaxID=2876637 RepID=UPI001CCAAB19|nr:hypothetical protein [Mesorhizobium sp. CA8]MBZ9764524.1 hypothetical protein [Mesorhizobium sp. CA8]